MKFSKKGKAALMAGMADYYFKKGYFDTSMKFAERSLNIYPDDPEAYQVMYKISRGTGAYTYTVNLIARILQFNTIPFSHNIKMPGGLEVEFMIQDGLFKEGGIKKEIVLPAGMYEFSIKARGSFAGGVWPHMIVRFNAKNAMDTYVNQAEWNEYHGIAIIDSLVNSLEIVYDNDYYNPENKEDRNLYIDTVTLKGLY